jgi:hypothetical protein
MTSSSVIAYAQNQEAFIIVVRSKVIRCAVCATLMVSKIMETLHIA